MVNFILEVVQRANEIQSVLQDQDAFPPLEWMKELRTLTIKAPRQVGHTTAAISLLRDHNATVIVPSRAHIIIYPADLRPRLLIPPLKGIQLDGLIIVDIASNLHPWQLHDLYRIADQKSFFVLLS